MRFFGVFLGIGCMVFVLLAYLFGFHVGKLSTIGMVAMLVGDCIVYGIVAALVCARSTHLVKKRWGAGFWGSGSS